MSKYVNNLQVTANIYADNIEKAVALIEKSKDSKSDYEKEVEAFYNKAVEMYKVNRLRC